MVARWFAFFYVKRFCDRWIKAAYELLLLCVNFVFCCLLLDAGIGFTAIAYTCLQSYEIFCYCWYCWMLVFLFVLIYVIFICSTVGYFSLNTHSCKTHMLFSTQFKCKSLPIRVLLSNVVLNAFVCLLCFFLQSFTQVLTLMFVVLKFSFVC